jgi:hypothetical protein
VAPGGFNPCVNLSVTLLKQRCELGIQFRLDFDFLDLLFDGLEVLAQTSKFGGQMGVGFSGPLLDFPFLDLSLELRMRAFLSAHPNGEHGNHSYSLAAFGMDPVELSECFSSYRTRFNLQRLLHER